METANENPIHAMETANENQAEEGNQRQLLKICGKQVSRNAMIVSGVAVVLVISAAVTISLVTAPTQLGADAARGKDHRMC